MVEDGGDLVDELAQPGRQLSLWRRRPPAGVQGARAGELPPDRLDRVSDLVEVLDHHAVDGQCVLGERCSSASSMSITCLGMPPRRCGGFVDRRGILHRLERRMSW